MTKSELTARILDRIVDPWTEDLEEYRDLKPIDLQYASEMLDDMRKDELGFEEEDKLPEETTPEILMEVFNSHVAEMQEKLRQQEEQDRAEHTKQYVVFHMLEVEPGREYEISVPADMKAVELMHIISPLLTTSVVSNISTKWKEV